MEYEYTTIRGKQYRRRIGSQQWEPIAALPDYFPAVPEYVPQTTDATDAVIVSNPEITPGGGIPSGASLDRLLGVLGANRGGAQSPVATVPNAPQAARPAVAATASGKIISVEQQVILGVSLLLLLYGLAKVRV